MVLVKINILQTIYWYVRHAIRDMVVRGAPAIAISAALALAAEVYNSAPFNGTPNDAASLIADKLDYLVSRYYMLWIQ